jgi:hypothetical protein
LAGNWRCPNGIGHAHKRTRRRASIANGFLSLAIVAGLRHRSKFIEQNAPPASHTFQNRSIALPEALG